MFAIDRLLDGLVGIAMAVVRSEYSGASVLIARSRCSTIS
jgi:hypothetical protein